MFFVGLGIDQSPTERAESIFKGCQYIYFENYTSPRLNADDRLPLDSESCGKKIERVRREFVEDGRKILERAKGENVALVSSGDPMIATTHQELRTRAIKAGIATQVVHGSSIISCIPGELGLHSYGFGKSVTITREPLQYTSYETIFHNLLLGLHTILLLEWDEASNYFLSPRDALEKLISAESDLKYGIITERTLMLGASRIGTDNEKLSACSLQDGRANDFGPEPVTLVIPGKLHFTEREALAALFQKRTEWFRDNSADLRKLSNQMVEKYSKRTLAALEKARAGLRSSESQKPSTNLLFENVEAYTQDALRFLNQGKDELAILSVGYAEGLLDSLRFLGLLEFEW